MPLRPLFRHARALLAALALISCGVAPAATSSDGHASGGSSGVKLAANAASHHNYRSAFRAARRRGQPLRRAEPASVPPPQGSPSFSALTSSTATGTPFAFLAPSLINLPQAQRPQPATNPGMTYDSVRARTVLFGGCTSASPCASNQTWTFDGDFWTQKAPATSPPARYDACFVFDPTTGNAVLFGGVGASGADLGDTWVWDGTNWTQKTPATAPSARHGAMASYLSSLGKVVLFGGRAGGTSMSDTWTWDGTNWTRLSPGTVPPARYEGGLAYTGTTGQLVLYGGIGSSGDLGDTWIFNGTSWAQQTPSATPGPLNDFAFAYDPTLNRPLLEGGTDGSGNYYADIWVWDGSTWDINGGNFVLRYGTITGSSKSVMAQTPTNGQLVLAGGQLSDGSRITETYKIDYPDSGFAPYYSLSSHRETDRSSDNVNMANLNLVYASTDFSIGGVDLPVDVDRQMDGLVGCVSVVLSCGWLLPFLDVGTWWQPDGSSQFVLDPLGRELYFHWNGTGFDAPPNSDLKLVKNGDGTETLTELHANVSYTINADGFVSAIKDRNGNTIIVNYDANDRVTTIVDTQGRTLAAAYDATTGQLASLTDNSGRKVSYAYNADWDLVSATLSDPNDPAPAATTMYSYDPGGDSPSQVTTPAGRIVKFSYANMNRLASIVRVTDPAHGTGPTTGFNHTGTPGKVLVTDPDSHQWTYTLDRSGSDHLDRISKVTDPNGHSRSSSFDASSNMTSFNGDNVSAVYNLTYDSNNNLTAFTSPSSNGSNTRAATTFSYQAPGQVFLPSSATDPRGNCRAFAYDGNGNLSDVYDGQVSPCNGLTGGTHLHNAYQGDAGVSCGAKAGELCSTTDGKGNVTSFAYDTSGNLTRVTSPSPLGQTTIVPDSLGRPASVTDGKGQTTRFSYDKADRVTKVLYGGATTCDAPHASCIEYAYDADGNLTSRISNIGTTTYTYDSLSRLTKKALPGPLVDACSGQTGMTLGYDNADNLTSYCDARGTVAYGYDAANELTSIQEPGGNCSANPVTGPCTKIGYLDTSGKFQDGRRTSVTFPPSTGVVTSLSYDNAGNLLSIVAKKGTATFSSFSYTYAQGTKDVAQRQTMTNTAGTTTSFRYDAFGRLCWFVSGSSSNACGSPPAGATSISYDANGNRTRLVAGGSTTNYAYNAADELCASSSGTASCSSPNYSYDADGNLTASPVFSTLTYNTKNQNSSRTRVGGSAVADVYADADQTERVTVGSLNLASSPLGLAADSSGTYYTRDPTGGLLGQRTGTTNYYTLSDGLGSVVGLIDSTGTLVKQYSYDPFGNVTIGAGSATSKHLFAGGYLDDPNEKLTKFGTRYYDTGTSRWTQRDPVPATIGNPQQANRYDYAGDDPIDFTDPTGTSLTSFFKDLATHIGLGGAAGAAYGCAVGALSAIELGPAGMLGVCLISGASGAPLGAVGGAIEDLQKYVGPIPAP